MIHSLILLKKIPHSPGCYLMKDVRGRVVYVGKAKDLRKRVASYTRARDEKTAALVSEIADIDYIATDTETESYLLEAQLIQKYHPHYNIDLQSGATRYAYIKKTNEPYPRLITARTIDRKGTFFGPYVSARARNEALRAIHQLFRLCKKPNSKRPCFRYRLGVCSGACAHAITPQKYRQSIDFAEIFLRGRRDEVLTRLRAEMTACAATRAFEAARSYRDQIRIIENIERQRLVHPSATNADVINYVISSDALYFQLFHFQRGVISGKKEFRFSLDVDHSHRESLLAHFVAQYYQSHTPPHEIIIPHEIEEKESLGRYLSECASRAVVFIIPEKGEKKALLELVKKNITLKLHDSGDELVELQRSLRLQRIPAIIDCVDISTLGGKDTVGSLVHFINGQSNKSGYRKFIMREVEGVNDYVAIAEVITRFCRHVVRGDWEKPDLLVIDGGRGQLNAAKKALKECGMELPTIGLAKRLEEVYVSWAKYPLRISHRSEALKLLQRLRDEAHRFAISFQRKRRSLEK